MIKLIFSIFVALATSGRAFEIDSYDFLMPDVFPYRDELYLCTPIRISPDTNYYIVGFEPNATMHTAHHMLLYGCTEPGTDDLVWGCGEMAAGGKLDTRYKKASPCKSGSQIVYAWARDAPKLELPDQVGFLIGRESPIKYLVLQVHYMHRFPEGKTDNSGVILKYTKTPMPRQAGVFLLGTGGIIAKNSVVNMETACRIKEHKTIHPFAFRTHTHSLGKVVSGYLIRKERYWRLIGKKNPMLPQMFYPVKKDMEIHEGDYLAARCTMNNTNDYPVKIGATNKHEMCNFYLMYWVDGTTPLEQKYCFSAGPPTYYWADSEPFHNIPEIEASTCEGSCAGLPEPDWSESVTSTSVSSTSVDSEEGAPAFTSPSVTHQ